MNMLEFTFQILYETFHETYFEIDFHLTWVNNDCVFLFRKPVIFQ